MKCKIAIATLVVIVVTFVITPIPALGQTSSVEPDPAFEPFMHMGDDPCMYIHRYAIEPLYKEWFDENFGISGLTIEQAAGLDSGQVCRSLSPDTDVIIPEGVGVAGCEENNWCYIPSRIEVEPGTTVTWENIDTVAHTVTAGSLADGITGEFDSSLLLADNIFEHTFEEVGEYPYYCIVHPWRAGEVVVRSGGSLMPHTPVTEITGTAVVSSEDPNDNTSAHIISEDIPQVPGGSAVDVTPHMPVTEPTGTAGVSSEDPNDNISAQIVGEDTPPMPEGGVVDVGDREPTRIILNPIGAYYPPDEQSYGPYIVIGNIVTFSGRVEDSSGRAVPGADVRIEEEDGIWGVNESIGTAKAGQDGLFSVAVTVEDWDYNWFYSIFGVTCDGLSGSENEIFAVYEQQSDRYEGSNSAKQNVCVRQSELEQVEMAEDPTGSCDTHTKETRITLEQIGDPLYVGRTNEFRGELTDLKGCPLPNSFIDIRERGNDDADLVTQGRNSESGGSYRLDWTVRDMETDQDCRHEFYAYFGGKDDYYLSSSSAEQNICVSDPTESCDTHTKETRITLEQIGDPLYVGRTNEFRGELTDLKGCPLPNSFIDIRERGNDDADLVTQGRNSESGGSYRLDWTVRDMETDQDCRHEFYAYFGGKDDYYLSSSSAEQNICVEPTPPVIKNPETSIDTGSCDTHTKETRITLDRIDDPLYVGDSYNFTGKITDLKGCELPNSFIDIRERDGNDGEILTQNWNSGSNGSFSLTWNPVQHREVTSDKVHEFYAYFGGKDDYYLPSSSAEQDVVVDNRDVEPCSTHTKGTRITLDRMGSPLFVGSPHEFRGELTDLNGCPLPNSFIDIRERNGDDANLVTQGWNSRSDGSYGLDWTVRDMESDQDCRHEFYAYFGGKDDYYLASSSAVQSICVEPTPPVIKNPQTPIDTGVQNTEPTCSTHTKGTKITLNRIDDPLDVGDLHDFEGELTDMKGCPLPNSFIDIRERLSGEVIVMDWNSGDDGQFSLTGEVENWRGAGTLTEHMIYAYFGGKDDYYLPSSSAEQSVMVDSCATHTKGTRITLNRIDGPLDVSRTHDFEGELTDMKGCPIPNSFIDIRERLSGEVIVMDWNSVDDGQFSLTGEVENWRGVGTLTEHMIYAYFGGKDDYYLPSSSAEQSVMVDSCATHTKGTRITLNRIDDPLTVGGTYEFRGELTDMKGCPIPNSFIDIRERDGRNYDVPTKGWNSGSDGSYGLNWTVRDVEGDQNCRHEFYAYFGGKDDYYLPSSSAEQSICVSDPAAPIRETTPLPDGQIYEPPSDPEPCTTHTKGTRITLNRIDDPLTVGDPYEFEGRITDLNGCDLPNSFIDIRERNGSDANLVTQGWNSGSDGSYRLDWTVRDMESDQDCRHEFYAYFGGKDDYYLASSSAVQSICVSDPAPPELPCTTHTKGTRITLNRIDDPLAVGDPYEFEGRITDLNGCDLPNSFIDIRERNGSDANLVTQGWNSGSDGSYRLDWTVRDMESDQDCRHEFYAYFGGKDDYYLASSSAVQSICVESTPPVIKNPQTPIDTGMQNTEPTCSTHTKGTRITLDRIDDPLYVGGTYPFTGRITDLNGCELPNSYIDIRERDGSDFDVMTKGWNSGSDGSFSLTWRPIAHREVSSDDVHEFYAYFGGKDDYYLPSSSAIQYVRVIR